MRFCVKDPLGSFPFEHQPVRSPVLNYEPVPEPRRRTRRSPVVLLLLLVLAAAGWGAFFYERARPIDPGIPTAAETSRPPEADVSAISRDTPGSFDTPPPPDSAPSVDRPKPVPPSVTPEPPEPPARAPEPARQESIATSGSLPNVAGSWAVDAQVESSIDVPVTGQQHAFELQLQQQGDRVTGVGRKVARNGSAVTSESQTPMTISGTIAGQRLTLNFIERDAASATQGKFVLLLQEDGTMRGRFSSTATPASALVEARRASNP